MNKVDTRRLPSSVQEEKRIQAIKLWTQGQSQKSIAEKIGITPETMCRWVKRYKTEGPAFFKSKKRGKKMGENRHLTRDQEEHLLELITLKTPEQLCIERNCWSRKAVMDLVEKEAGIKMPVRTVGEYLKRWGFTPQKPEKQVKAISEKIIEVEDC